MDLKEHSVYSSNQNVLGARFVLGTVLGTWGTSGNWADSGPCPLGFIFQHSKELRKGGA